MIKLGLDRVGKNQMIKCIAISRLSPILGFIYQIENSQQNWNLTPTVFADASNVMGTNKLVSH